MGTAKFDEVVAKLRRWRESLLDQLPDPATRDEVLKLKRQLDGMRITDHTSPDSDLPPRQIQLRDDESHESGQQAIVLTDGVRHEFGADESVSAQFPRPR
jgi:hypothetical protein